MKKKKKKAVINKQKLFCFASFLFILICCFWYGGRSIYYYLDSRKTIENEDKLLAQMIITKNENEDNFKKINSDYYFYGDADSNYLLYSNLLWRIVKVSKDKEIMLVLDKPITSLAYGSGKSYKNNYISKWLNSGDVDNTGILGKNLNDSNKYLMTTSTCIDNVNNIKKISCDKVNDDYNLSLLSLVDYINTGGEKGFANSGNNFYLANSKGSKMIWYVTDNGKLDTSDGNDIIGVKPTITIKPTVSVVEGNGSLDNPYVVEENKGYFASYVKLDDDIWQVYDTFDDKIMLVLNDNLKINGKDLEYVYSNSGYIHNDTVYGSIAYYLNNYYLKKLSYNNIVITNDKYINYFYGEENKYDYGKVFSKTIDTKVYMLSIGNVMFNNDVEDYFIATGVGSEDDDVYLFKKNNLIETISVDEEKYVRPCITISKENLKAGTGSISDPYRTE